jgi:hypothetical protein
VAPKPYQNKNLFLGTRDGRTPALPVYNIFLPGESIPLYPLHAPRLSQLNEYTVIQKLRYLDKQLVKLFLVLVHLPIPITGEK